MILQAITLQNFRSYSQTTFNFSPEITLVVGPNTAGKTNLAEAIHLLSTGKSFKTGADTTLIQFGKEIGRIKCQISNEEQPHPNPLLRGEGEYSEKTTLEVVCMSPQYNNGRFGKKFLVNDVPKSRMKFLGNVPLVLFRPEELDIIIDGPSVRRDFLNEVLEQVDREYVTSLLMYERSLRQRNALLDRVRESGIRQEEQFAYWDDLVIEHGQVITKKRDAFISWVQKAQKDIIDFHITYDHSTISPERLLQYKNAEIDAGVTLVGPHRDDFFIEIAQEDRTYRDVRIFGSRGQQRLVVLQLKLLQIQYTTEILGEMPLLVLDDIFSELDTGHIQLVLQKISGQQAIITTTHKEFIPEEKMKSYSIIELN